MPVSPQVFNLKVVSFECLLCLKYDYVLDRASFSQIGLENKTPQILILLVWHNLQIGHSNDVTDLKRFASLIVCDVINECSIYYCFGIRIFVTIEANL